MSEASSDPGDVRETTSVTDGGGTGPSVLETVRQGIRYAIFAVLLTLAALWFLGEEGDLLRYLILSGLLALGLEPGVTWLHDKHGWRRGSATGLLLVGLFLALILLGAGAVAVLARETNQVVHQLPLYVDKLNGFTRTHFHTTVVSASQRAAAANATSHIQDFLKQHQSDVIGGFSSALSSVFTLFTVGLFTFYLTAQGPQVRRALLSRMRPERQQHVLFATETAIQKMGGYLYSRLLLAAINGALMFITLKILGVPFALPLAMLSGLIAEFIPIVGTYVGGALPVIVALAERGPSVALIVLAEIVVYQQLENYILSPRISGKTIELNPGIAFGSALAGGTVGGFVGAFFALPIAATIQAFIAAYSTSYEVADSALTRVDEPPPPSDSPKRGGRLWRRSKGGESGSPEPDPHAKES